MKPFCFLVAAALLLAAAVAAITVQTGKKADTDRATALDFFGYERPPTQGGQEMKPRWGG